MAAMMTSSHHLLHHTTIHPSSQQTTLAFLNDTSDRQERENCYLKYADDALTNDTSYCPMFWDGWGCWNYTKAGTTAFISCPSHIKGFDTRLTASRECTDDGDWWTSPITNKTWSDYTTCVNAFELHLEKQVIMIYLFGYGLSLVVLVTSLIIFAIFNRQLKCDRVTVHKHLFVCNLFNCAAWIVYYVITYFGLEIIAENSIYCRLLHIASQYITVSMYLWMFCEGLYLHTVIVFGFTSGAKLLAACYVIGWVFPLLTTCLYGGLRGQSEDTTDCWFHESKWSWINNGVVIFTFAANAIFLCNIIRVLITKLRAVNSSDVNQVRKALRATMILVPLLGIQFIFFSSMPDEDHSFKKVYQVLVALINSLQGFFLALLFCFLNGEVIQLVKRRAHMRSQQKSIRRRSSAHNNSAICTALSYPLHDLQQQNSYNLNNNNSSLSSLSQKSRTSHNCVARQKKFKSPMKWQTTSFEFCTKRKPSPDLGSPCNPLLRSALATTGLKKGSVVSFNEILRTGDNLTDLDALDARKKDALMAPCSKGT